MFPDKAYVALQLHRIDQLLAENKKKYRVDLHIHTCYSADGIQTVSQAIENAKINKFDIISIADHDTIAAYDELLSQSLFAGKEIPVIIPGVEFTVSYPEYEGRCHVLKYFYDANSVGLRENLAQNERAFQYRVHLWFIRIRENSCLNYYFSLYNIDCDEEDYCEFLRSNGGLPPDYPTLMQYLYSLLSEKGITIWDVYQKEKDCNEADLCEPRKAKKKRALMRFYDKYKHQDIAYNFRKLRPILAPLGIDDNDYPGYRSSGCLSVGEYGQLEIQKLVNTGVNILAHPDIGKLTCVDTLTEIVSGLELNCRSEEKANCEVYKKARGMNLLITKGSDKHSNTNESYEDMSFYEISHWDLSRFVWQVRQSL